MLRVDAATVLGALELDVSFEVAAGECLALAGPSGAGKTSVLRVVAELLGQARARGGRQRRDLARRGAQHRPAPEQRRPGYVFQEYALFPHLSAWQNVACRCATCRAAARARWSCSSDSG